MATNTSKHTHLPISRVKTIMKSSPDVENVSSESIHLVAKAAELFIQYLARKSLKFSGSETSLQYKDVALIVDQDQELEFLRELIPLKITIGQYKDIMNKKNKSCSPISSCDDAPDCITTELNISK